MPKKDEHKKAMLKAGIFIIITIGLLAFSLLWLRHYSIQPEKVIKVKFDDPGPISEGLPIYYQGVNVGRVGKIGFSDDYQYTIVDAEIYRKNLDLPKNIYTTIKLEGITGQKYLSLEYPKNPSSEIIEDGDVIIGKASKLSEIQDFMSKNISEEDLKSAFQNLKSAINNAGDIGNRVNNIVSMAEEILGESQQEIKVVIKNAKTATDDLRYVTGIAREFSLAKAEEPGLRQTLNSLSLASGKFQGITENIDKVAASKEVQEGITKAITGFGNIVTKVDKTIGQFEVGTPGTETVLQEAGGMFSTANRFLNNMDIRTGRVLDEITESNLINNSSYAMCKIGVTASKAGNTLDKISDTQFDGQLKSLIYDTICDINRTVNRYDNIACGLSNMMDEKYLLFKLMFGKPFGSFQTCSNVQDCMQHLYKAQSPTIKSYYLYQPCKP